MRRKFMRELAALGLPPHPGAAFDRTSITEVDVQPLPGAAQRYLRFMRVVGRPRDWSFRLRPCWSKPRHTYPRDGYLTGWTFGCRQSAED